MKNLATGTRFNTPKYEYTITGCDQSGLSLATVKMRGLLGSIDTGITVRLVPAQGHTNPKTDALMHSDAQFETFRINGVIYYAVQCDNGTIEAMVDDDASNAPTPQYDNSSENKTKHDADGFVRIGQSRYRGQMSNGHPNGKGTCIMPDGAVWKGFWASGKPSKQGTIAWPNGQVYEGQWNSRGPSGQGKMTYPDKRVYTGMFRDGMRHGHGTLRMPDGECFKGEFINDKITDNGTYYDSKGRTRNVKPTWQDDRGMRSTFWSKTWRLWAALACFAMIPLSIWALYEFFTGTGTRHIRVGAFIAPMLFLFKGFGFLIEFIDQFTGNGNKK